MEHFNDMNHHRTDSDHDEELDVLLASLPVIPSPDFTEKTLARISLAAGDDERALDALIASRPLPAPAGMPDRVLRAVATERRRRFLLVRLATPLALAACLAIAALPAILSDRSSGDRLGAALKADAELGALAALPIYGNPTLNSDELATLADLGAALAHEEPDYSYEI